MFWGWALLLPVFSLAGENSLRVLRSAWIPVPDVTCREYWEPLRKDPGFQKVLLRADKVLGSSSALPTKECYLEYSRTGSRTGYEKQYFSFLRDLNATALSSCVTGDERYLVKLEGMIRQLCHVPTWILPAHDVGLKNLNGEQVRIDLVSSAVSWDLAWIGRILNPALSPDIRTLLRENLLKRTVVPYEKSATDWRKVQNNWNSVCLSGVAGTLLGIDLDASRRETLLREVMAGVRGYLLGFPRDGYCSEGVDYWSYGFGHYLKLSAMLFLASNGAINLLDDQKAALIASYPEKIRLSGQLLPAFSDCTFNTRIPGTWIAMCDWLLGRTRGCRELRIDPINSFSENILNIAIPKTNEIDRFAEDKLPAFSEFPDAGIFVLRPLPGAKTRLAAAVKGGSNNEFHNHNDVGSYVLAVDGSVPVAVDPGAEHYDGRSFSARRYESKLNNSFGHSVPRINGQLQIAGKGTESKVLKKHLSDTDAEIVFDIRKAYHQISSIRKLERTFRYSRAGSGTFEVADSVSLSEPGTFETAVITFGTWKQTTQDKLILTYRGKKVEVTVDTGGKPFRVSSEEIREKIRWKENPHRIAVTLSEPVLDARIRLTYRIPEEQ